MPKVDSSLKPAQRAEGQSTPITASDRAKRPRLTDIDHVKAIAIVLVVYGHVVAREPPRGDDWYLTSKYLLYLFHMPLFMFVSGLILAYTYKPIRTLGDYGRYVGKRASRLLPAYLIMGIVIVVGKMVAARVMHVDHAPAHFSDALLILTRPYDGPAAFLWYVYVLFIYYLTLPPLFQFLGSRVEWLLVLGLGLYFLPRTDLLGIGQYTEYFVFVAAGVVAAKHLDSLRRVADRWFVAWSVGFIALGIAFGFGIATGQVHQIWTLVGMLLLGFAAIPFFLGLVRIRQARPHPVLDVWAKYTFTIYLFNTMFIGLSKGVMMKFVNWDGPMFLIFLPCLWLAGVIFPIVLHRSVLSRVPKLASITI